MSVGVTGFEPATSASRTHLKPRNACKHTCFIVPDVHGFATVFVSFVILLSNAGENRQRKNPTDSAGLSRVLTSSIDWKTQHR